MIITFESTAQGKSIHYSRDEKERNITSIAAYSFWCWIFFLGRTKLFKLQIFQIQSFCTLAILSLHKNHHLNQQYNDLVVFILKQASFQDSFIGLNLRILEVYDQQKSKKLIQLRLMYQKCYFVRIIQIYIVLRNDQLCIEAYLLTQISIWFMNNIFFQVNRVNIWFKFLLVSDESE